MVCQIWMQDEDEDEDEDEYEDEEEQQPAHDNNDEDDEEEDEPLQLIALPPQAGIRCVSRESINSATL